MYLLKASVGCGGRCRISVRGRWFREYRPLMHDAIITVNEYWEFKNGNVAYRRDIKVITGSREDALRIWGSIRGMIIDSKPCDLNEVKNNVLNILHPSEYTIHSYLKGREDDSLGFKIKFIMLTQG